MCCEEQKTKHSMLIVDNAIDLVLCQLFIMHWLLSFSELRHPEKLGIYLIWTENMSPSFVISQVSLRFDLASASDIPCWPIYLIIEIGWSTKYNNIVMSDQNQLYQSGPVFSCLINYRTKTKIRNQCDVIVESCDVDHGKMGLPFFLDDCKV